jgi:hypothetical protein
MIYQDEVLQAFSLIGFISPEYRDLKDYKRICLPSKAFSDMLQ